MCSVGQIDDHIIGVISNVPQIVEKVITYFILCRNVILDSFEACEGRCQKLSVLYPLVAHHIRQTHVWVFLFVVSPIMRDKLIGRTYRTFALISEYSLEILWIKDMDNRFSP